MREKSSGPDDSGAALAYCQSPRRSGRLAQAGPVFWVVACGAILILGIVLGIGGVIGNFQDREVQRSQKELENTVGLLASQIDSQFGHFESIERSVAALASGEGRGGVARVPSSRLTASEVEPAPIPGQELI